VHLNSGHGVGKNDLSPFLVDGGVIRQKDKQIFEERRMPCYLWKCHAKAIVSKGACGYIPELHDILRSDADSVASPAQEFDGVPRRLIHRVVALKGAEKYIGVDEYIHYSSRL
jgi:hypothetical protein